MKSRIARSGFFHVVLTYKDREQDHGSLILPVTAVRTGRKYIPCRSAAICSKAVQETA